METRPTPPKSPQRLDQQNRFKDNFPPRGQQGNIVPIVTYLSQQY